MTLLRAIILLMLCPALSLSRPTDSLGVLFGAALQKVKQHFCPDRRVSVFDITWTHTDSTFDLRGEVDDSLARDSILAVAAQYATVGVTDSIMVLPHPSLGTKTYGIVVLSVGNVRSRPGEAEELSTQVTMGLVVKVLKKSGGYYYVQSHDDYLGWLNDDAFQFVDQQGVDDWAAAQKVVVTEYFDIVREQPSKNALPVSDVVIGNILKAGKVKGSWRSVELADGRTGFLPTRSVQLYDSWRQGRNLSGDNVERTAKLFMGVPYLWGGTSSKGMDCSGFTKTVFRLNGLELNRDASQQVLMGRDVDPGKEFENLRKGDLLFFGRAATDERPERISHVAIFLKDRLFIHSSGRVRYSSLDPASPLFDEYNLKRFVRVRRVIPESTVPEK